MRNGKVFPLEDNLILAFLKKAWDEGWLDEFSDDHFLIRAIENRLDDFVGRIQLSTNNWAMYCPRKAIYRNAEASVPVNFINTIKLAAFFGTIPYIFRRGHPN